ncbi:hypothetical protein I4U23_021229 [Adineta vaga]|nr:hypothetical protein I4U23_021229 [Adineta vaga]
MFTIALFSVYTFALVISSSAENPSNDKQYTIKGVDTTYTQHISTHDQCTVEINDQNEKTQMLTEGEIIKIKNKWFKVEDCRLNRAYVAPCGSKLFSQMRDLVCSYVANNSKKPSRQRRQSNDDLINLMDRTYYGLCCQSACTISELLQYCPPK